MLNSNPRAPRSIELPFDTENQKLSFALYMAGVPFADETCQLVNIYDKDILFRIGGGEKDSDGNITRESKYSGLSLKDAISQAFEDRRKGQVRYGFEKVDLIQELTSAFNDQQKQTIESDEQARDMARRIIGDFSSGIYTIEEMILRLVVLFLKSRELFLDLPWGLEPWVRVHKKGNTTGTPESGKTRHPGFVIAPLSQADKMFAEVGV